MSHIQSLDGQLHLGGDPGRHPEFAQLGEELGKLTHPACPDVDWLRVEHLSRHLLRIDGPQLQSAAAFALARSRLYGAPGMLEGIGLIEALVRQWPSLWPRQPNARVAILCGLFEQLRKALRSGQALPYDRALLDHLDARLARLQALLAGPASQVLPEVQALREQIGRLMGRVDACPEPSLVVPDYNISPAIALPGVPTPLPTPIQRRARRSGPWLASAALVVLLGGIGGLSLWHVGPVSRAVPPAAPLTLDSLRLFDPGSAELQPASLKVLLNALEEIRKHPGRLVIITGHADASGTPEHNLRLSQARAQTVGDWLQRMGDIPAGCIAVQGVADHLPVASNADPSGRSANRRVDIRLVTQSNGCG